MATERAAVHIFEPSALGHRPYFLAWLLADPPTERRWILHTSAEVLAHPAMVDLLRAPPAGLTVLQLPHCPGEPARKTPVRLLRYQVGKALAIRRGWTRHAKPGDTAFIPYYDDLSLALVLLPWLLVDMPLVTIGMRAQFHLSRQGIASSGAQRGSRVKEWLLRRLLARRGGRCYLTNQLPLKRDVDLTWGSLAGKVRFYPDPAERPAAVGRDEARRRLGLDGGRRHVLCYGSLTSRKGVAHLLDALDSPAWPADMAAVIAGTCRDGVDALLGGARAEALAAKGLLHRRPGFVAPETENLLFQAADAVWLVYDGFDFMSGCLVQAGMHHRPVVGCTTGLISWYARTFSGGVLHDPSPTRREDSLRGLNAWLGDPRRMAADGESLARAFARHGREDFRAAVHAAILGRPDPFTGFSAG